MHKIPLSKKFLKTTVRQRRRSVESVTDYRIFAERKIIEIFTDFKTIFLATIHLLLVLLLFSISLLS